jgi:hypothetical protein
MKDSFQKPFLHTVASAVASSISWSRHEQGACRYIVDEVEQRPYYKVVVASIVNLVDSGDTWIPKVRVRVLEEQFRNLFCLKVSTSWMCTAESYVGCAFDPGVGL